MNDTIQALYQWQSDLWENGADYYGYSPEEYSEELESVASEIASLI